MCDHFKELMNAYIDGDITNAQIRELDLHVESCDTCMVEFEELKYLKHLLDEEGLMPLPDDFDERLHQKLLNANENLTRSDAPRMTNSIKSKVLNLSKMTKVVSSIAAVFVIGIFAYGALNGGNLNTFKMGSSYEETADMAFNESSAGYSEAGYAGTTVTTTESTESAAAYDVSEGDFILSFNEESADYDMVEDDGAAYTVASGRTALVDKTANQEAVDGYRTERIILKSANISMDTEDYDAAIEAIRSLLNGTEGYIASENTSFKTRYTDRDNLKYGSLVLRVTSSQFDDMLTTIKAQGFVNYNNISSQDVTKNYRDTASEIENLKVTETRLREILEEADEVSDILAIENELTRVRGQIDAYTNQLKNWEDLADLSYVYVELNEVTSINPTIEPIDNSILTRAKEGFIDSINTIIEVISDSFVWLIAKAPILLILGIVFGLGVRTFRRRKKTPKL